ncbi:nuclear pore glycoprotein p62-like [Solenopsis invicta]|uniref:nuclear pore glycoprotein p62-like n=1 Tax=Solenopsis invicta TaxID=13686 RepID=UPI00193D8CFA|nr:nuclear pore glycoprotein p62-like [Solenopsis invicta]
MLGTNGDKIVMLNQEVERVKIEWQQLDYVVGQQKELQECLVPLEKELALLRNNSIKKKVALEENITKISAILHMIFFIISAWEYHALIPSNRVCH